jgi:hypothetical protein
MSQTTEISRYEQQALDFLKETGTTFQAVFSEYAPYFSDDKESRNIYKITLRNKKWAYSFQFGQSVYGTQRQLTPTAYDVLACLQNYDPEDFEWFCKNYGYDTDSRKAEKTWKACCKQFKAVQRLFTEEQIEKLQEIQ